MRGLAMLLALATEAAARTDDPQATVTKTDEVELLVAQLVAPLQSQVEALQSRVSALEEENASLWRRVQGGEGGAEASASVVLPTGEARRGRQLTGEPESSAPTCCRWTQDDTCSSAGSASEWKCTSLHEYLEHKTTTHEFEDLNRCLGADHTKWKWKYLATQAGVQLSNSDPVATPKTPLKVTHAADCANVSPMLTVQLDTSMAGTLSVSGASTFSDLTANATTTNHLFAGGVDLLPRLLRTLQTGPPSAEFLIQSGYNGMCIAPATNADQIMLYNCDTSSSSQKWKWEGWMLVNAASGKCLEISGGTSNDGQAIAQYSCDPTNLNQKWSWGQYVSGGSQLVNFKVSRCMGTEDTSSWVRSYFCEQNIVYQHRQSWTLVSS